MRDKVLAAIILFAIFVLSEVQPVHAQSRRTARPDAVGYQTRGQVMTRYGIVATSQLLASQAGVQILEQGGNAVDAAIAANAVLGVVEPTSNGLGGDLFAIVYEARTGKLYGLNASGWAPSRLTIDHLRQAGYKKMPERGIYSATVPGVVSGWDQLRKRFGTKEFATILAPAISYARDGYPVSERIAAGWQGSRRLLAGHPNAAATFLPDGRAPKAGEIFRNPDLSRSLELIAEKGRDGFYRGRIAEAIVQISNENKGTYELSDLADFQAEWVEPISTTYHGWTVTELPPNGQGIAALIMLNIMEEFPLAKYGQNSAQALHVMIEAKKLAYADLLRQVGDPKFSKIPVKELLSKALAKLRAKRIDLDHAQDAVPPSDLTELARKPGSDTIYMCAIDKDGNIVSLIQSNYAGFGSGLVPSLTGFMLQNRGALFTLEPNQPNSLAPHKRPLHTIIPGFLQKDDIRIGFGIMGGWNQAQAHAQFVSNVVDFGFNVQGALESPRFTKMSFAGLDVEIEPRIPDSVRKELARKGHQLQVLNVPYSGTVGGGQAVMSNGAGVHFGGSDPRKDGAAIPQGTPLR
jgi:gamma-glutamyltranspeptidase/glutathione hydrolase